MPKSYTYPQPNELTTLADAVTTMERLEALLSTLGIRITPGSDLERGSLTVRYMADYHCLAVGGARLPSWPGPNMRDDLQVALGIHNLAQLILARSENPSFRQLLPHLRLLATGTAAQTRPARVTDQASNKLFESQFALACLRTTDDLVMEDPDRQGREPNPDILARMQDQNLWGFACKVVHGENPLGIWQAIEKGVSQIEKSKANTGIVIVSFKNKLPHDQLLPVLATDGDGDPIFGALPDPAIALATCADLVATRINRMVSLVTKEEIAKRFCGSKALPAIAVPVEMAVSIRTRLGAMPSLLSHIHTLTMERATENSRFGRAAAGVLDGINLGLVAGRVQRT